MFSIRTPEDAPDVASAVKYLFSNKLHTDFYFISRDGMEKHPVHKLIVAVNSPVLAKMLYGDKPIDFLQIKYDDNIALRNLLSFFYDGELFLENISDIRHTKAIAERYEIPQLCEICKDELNNISLSMADVLSIIETARELKNERKENECLEFIIENQEAIFTSRQFLGWSFRNVLDIFEKYKRMGKMTDALILRLAIRWIDTNGNKDLSSKKELLVKKVDVTSISLDDYLEIVIEFPTFFSNVEISYTVKEIKSHCAVVGVSDIHETRASKKEFRDVQTNTEEQKHVETIPKVKDEIIFSKDELLADVKFFRDELNKATEANHNLGDRHELLVIEFESKKLQLEERNREIKELEQTVKKLREKVETPSPMSSLSYSSLDSKQKQLSIVILNQEDGVNVFDFVKRAKITVQEGSTIRSLQVAVDDCLKKGLIGTVAEKKGSYSESDVDISYEGVYFMLRSLSDLDETLSPIQYIEVLKAALHFQLKGVAEKCIKRLNGITDYDPVFLDGLRSLSYLKDKCLGLKGLSEFKDRFTQLLLSEPLRVILHPNFTKCSVDLIIYLLQQSELKVKDESQLLLVIIAWLEAQKDDRRLFRKTLLTNLAFQNISTADFRYAIIHYPHFFDEKEQKLILAFRNAVGSEVKFFRDNLPEWYSVKTRKHI